MLMGFFNSGDAAAALLTVVLVHGALDYLVGSRHDVLAARPQAVLQAIAKFTSRAAERV
jgi:hypothetical protein